MRAVLACLLLTLTGCQSGTFQTADKEGWFNDGNELFYCKAQDEGGLNVKPMCYAAERHWNTKRGVIGLIKAR